MADIIVPVSDRCASLMAVEMWSHITLSIQLKKTTAFLSRVGKILQKQKPKWLLLIRKTETHFLAGAMDLERHIFYHGDSMDPEDNLHASWKQEVVNAFKFLGSWKVGLSPMFMFLDSFLLYELKNGTRATEILPRLSGPRCGCPLHSRDTTQEAAQLCPSLQC